MWIRALKFHAEQLFGESATTSSIKAKPSSGKPARAAWSASYANVSTGGRPSLLIEVRIVSRVSRRLLTSSVGSRAIQGFATSRAWDQSYPLGRNRQREILSALISSSTSTG